MSTLYVENVPDELYEALRKRAREHRNSISAEVLLLLGENVPTNAELARRSKLLKRAAKLRAKVGKSRNSQWTAEELQRQDRAR